MLYKNSAFESSSPIQHAMELTALVQNKLSTMLILYSDGRPDHRLTYYMSMKLSLISFFVNLNLDYLCAGPYHSFRNPPERVMSVLNLGLQSVGLARHRMEVDMESVISHCNSVSEIQRIAKDNSNLKEALVDSIAHAKITLSSVTQR